MRSLREPVARGHGRAQQPLERRRGVRNLVPLGAPVSHGMHSFYGHTLPYIEGKTWDDGLEFLAGSLYFSDFCLIVNQLGLRFTDESVGCIDEHNAERGCQQTACARYYVVFDERIRRERIDVDLMGIPGIEATRVPAKLVQLRGAGSADRHRRHARR